jgi:PAS domain S-box-containing protein
MANQQPLQTIDAAGRRAISDMQMLLEATGVGMWSYDAASNTFNLDETCRAMFDLDPDEPMSMATMRSRIHPEDIDHYWRAVATAKETGELRVNYRVVRKDGSIRFISGRGRAVLPASGSAFRVKGVCIDVTEQRHLEHRLRHTEERLQNLADGVPGLFSYIDGQYRVQFMSSLYRQIFNRPGDELIGKHIAELIGADAFAERQARYDSALAGQVVHHEATRTMPDGEQRYFTITHHPHRDANGDIQGVLSLAIDITDRREVEEALENKHRELERSNRDLEQFAYIASHDLKAPLRAIDHLVQWLREDLADVNRGEVQENLGLLSQRTDRLNRLLDDLLEYSRAGRRVGELRRTDTCALVQDIAALLAPPPAMAVKADPCLPVLLAYEAPLEQVLRNLIHNAIKHHPSGTGCVRIHAQDQGTQVMFAVEDDGGGIPPEYADKVFEMFQTLQPRDEREGSGMGLAIVKRIIDWQGGRIWFHPGPGNRGTVFKFTWNKVDTGIKETTGNADPELRYSAG